MTPRGVTPASQHRRLRRALRDARDRQRLTQKDVAEALDWSTSKLIRIENGTVGISVTDLKALLLHYGVTEAAEVDEMVEMARASKKVDWWHQYREHYSQQFITFLALEASAIRIRQFQGLLVPGLLQIPEYVRTLGAISRINDEGIQRHTDVRLKRQELLRDDGPEMFFILDESVLYRMIGDTAVMRAQLRRLSELTDHPRLSIQILPFSAGVHRGMTGSFEIFELSEEPDDYALLLEQPYRDALHPDPSEETKEFVNIFYELEKIALPREETPRVIEERLSELE